LNWNYEEGRIYSLDEKGGLLAEANYSGKENGEIDIEHIYVNPILRGQGVAEKIMEAIVEYLREQSIKATATCSYASSWFEKNREKVSDIISSNQSEQDVACRIDGKK